MAGHATAVADLAWLAQQARAAAARARREQRHAEASVHDHYARLLDCLATTT